MLQIRASSLMDRATNGGSSPSGGAYMWGLSLRFQRAFFVSVQSQCKMDTKAWKLLTSWTKSPPDLGLDRIYAAISTVDIARCHILHC